MYLSSLRLHQEYIPSNQYPFKHATILRSHLYTLCDLPGNEAERINIASVQERYEALLRRITTFPKAGEVNVRILDFVDRCFEIWSQNNSESALKLHARHEIDEADTLRIIAITERALSYTFQSHRLLRYLLTLQMALNNKRQVLKSFMLYSKLWEKAKETDLVEVSRKLRRFRDEDQSSAGGVNGENGKNTGNFDGPPPSPPSNQTIKSSAEEADVDELTTFIETCCVATKVFLSEPREENHARKATAQMTRALELVPSDADSSLRAVCRMWCGIAKSCQALDGMFLHMSHPCITVLTLTLQRQTPRPDHSF